MKKKVILYIFWKNLSRKIWPPTGVVQKNPGPPIPGILAA